MINRNTQAHRDHVAALQARYNSYALWRAKKALAARQGQQETLRKNSFAARGNLACINRLRDTIRAMETHVASPRQYRYWHNH